MNQPVTPPDPYAYQTFDRFIAGHERGQLNADLSEQLREVIAKLSNHVIDHGGEPAATMSVKIKIQLKGGVFIVSADTDKTLPKAPRAASIYFATPGNVLSPRDPRQLEMPLRDVASGPARPSVNVS